VTAATNLLGNGTQGCFLLIARDDHKCSRNLGFAAAAAQVAAHNASAVFTAAASGPAAANYSSLTFSVLLMLQSVLAAMSTTSSLLLQLSRGTDSAQCTAKNACRCRPLCTLELSIVVTCICLILPWCKTHSFADINQTCPDTVLTACCAQV